MPARRAGRGVAAALLGLAACDPAITANVLGLACDAAHGCPTPYVCTGLDGGVCVVAGPTGGTSGGSTTASSGTAGTSSSGSGTGGSASTDGGTTGGSTSNGSSSSGSSRTDSSTGGSTGSSSGSSGSSGSSSGSSGGSSSGTAGCVIQGKALDAGALNPSNACQACEPAAATDAWTNLPPGTGCAPGEICDPDGGCSPSCDVDGGFVADQALDPTNPCELCDTSSSSFTWTRAADGMPCGPGSFCVAGACEDGCVLDGGTGCGCPTGFQTCIGAAVDTCTDDLNCGACANACGAETGCFGGTCTTPALLPTARFALALVKGVDGRLFAIGGANLIASGFVSVVEIYDPRTNVWDAGPDLPEQVEFPAAAVDASGDIFVFGGGNTQLVSQTLELSPGASAWSTSPPPSPEPFAATQAAVGPGGVFFMPAGLDTSGPQTAVWTFNPLSQSWGTAPSLPLSTSYEGVAAGADGTLYVLGGTNSDTSPNVPSALALPPDAGAWGPLPAMPTPRCAFGTAVDGAGSIYAISGFNCDIGTGARLEGALEAYVPTLGSWRSAATTPDLPPIPNSVEGPGAVTGDDGRIYAIGGWNGFSVQSVVQVYNPQTNSWVP